MTIISKQKTSSARNRANDGSITYFLINETAQSLAESKIFSETSDQFTEKQSHENWQEHFCLALNYHKTEIPWNLLRASDLELAKEVQTIVCCDPISIQMTHRGAYCWGQTPLSLSKEDAHLIVEKINETLMGEGEQLLLVDDLAWLYISNEKLDLKEASFERLIGKDLFDFRYQGHSQSRWSRLATEMQMLIKQLMDYKKIEPCSPEASVAVHFWADTSDTFENAFLRHRKNQADDHNTNLIVYSSDERLNEFIRKNNVIVNSLGKFSELDEGSDKEKVSLEENKILIVSEKINQSLSDIITMQIKDNKPIEIVVQDRILATTTDSKTSIFTRLLSILNFGEIK